MKRVAKWMLMAVLTVVLALAALLAHTVYAKPLKLDWFYTRVFASFALDSPELLSSLRILPGWLDFYSAKLDDASPAHERKMTELVKHELAVLDQYDRKELDREGQLSYDTLHQFLQLQADGEPFSQHDFPLNQMAGMQSALPNFMAQVHQVKSKGEADNYIARLNKFPRKLSELLEGLKQREAKGVIPPRFTVEKVLVQMNGFVAKAPQDNPLYLSLKEKLAKIPAAQLDDAARAQLLAQAEAAIKDSVYPAYRQLIAYFVALQPKASVNNGAWSLPNGDAYYAWSVRMHTTTDMTPQQVHELGLAEVARVGGEMDAILRQQGLAEGTIGTRVQTLARRPEQQYANTAEGKAAMLAGYQAILDEVNKGLDGAFDVRPKLGVEVRPVPAASEASAPGAYYEPGAFDGSRPGVFYANMRAPGETPKFAMRTLAYHEGIPGHHFQIAIAQELSGVPFFRKVIPFTAYQEGWALYAERLAYELGFQKKPLDNLGRLRDEMMRATRLVVDSGIHYKHWTREQAISYMMDNTGMAEGDVTAEVERYFVAPGQALAYKVGMLKILALREHAKRELGARFDLKQFHNEVLKHGALPLTVLERVIEDWIVARKKV
ncbi:DUF885 domain-containing protein [Rugamonas rubra]|uniref:Uncharacterized conserved protein, DUF885 familyt n=1 Tax=Rugamonas rubra TaxID=758825 RepID=A0A1I4NNQ6_9BURK|nr:DUF885 domain-containing protein [Rugamonas rubra]SFM17162.1 Uncharacterized conserved protein, DUF885 familyt [Rugamonas rubra]